jgi:hypothetical protein
MSKNPIIISQVAALGAAVWFITDVFWKVYRTHIPSGWPGDVPSKPYTLYHETIVNGDAVPMTFPEDMSFTGGTEDDTELEWINQRGKNA